MTSDLESGTACALARRKKLQIKRKGKVATLGAYGYLVTLLFVFFGCALATSAEIQKDKTYGADQQQASECFLPDVFSFRYGCFRPRVDLNGTWQFQLDKEGVGVARGWHEGKGSFDRTIEIPGVPQAQGIGTPNSRQKSQFLDSFWVRRKFQMPHLESGKRVWLRLGGVLPAAEVYLNGHYLGVSKSGFVPFGFDLTPWLRFDAPNVLAVMCDNRFMKDPPAGAGPESNGVTVTT